MQIAKGRAHLLNKIFKVFIVGIDMKKVYLVLGVVIVVLVVVLYGLTDGGSKDSGVEVSMGQNSSENQTSVSSPVNQATVSSPPEQASLPSSSISLEELSLHSDKNDCWVGFEGKVYDLTDYLDKHPGGSFVIARYCGTAESFEKSFLGKHARKHVAKLEPYVQGVLA